MSDRSDLKLEKFSADIFNFENLTVLQPEKGYRFSSDPFLLASQIKFSTNEHILDVGTGCGIIPLLLISRNPDVRMTGIEIQKQLYEFAVKNVRQNRYENSIRILNMDARKVTPEDLGGRVDRIVANPPFIALNQGRKSPDRQRAVACQEILINIRDLFTVAQRILMPSGSIHVILPANRLDEFKHQAEQHTFFTKTVCSVYTNPEKPPIRVILSADRTPCEKPLSCSDLLLE